MLILPPSRGPGGRGPEGRGQDRAGGDALTLYQWGTNTARHHFCKVCGIYMCHNQRANPDRIGVNMGTLKGVNPADHEPIPWTDGVNHPSDRKP